MIDISILPEDEKAALVGELEAIGDRGEGMVWIDKERGVFEYPYETDLFAWRRKVVS